MGIVLMSINMIVTFAAGLKYFYILSCSLLFFQALNSLYANADDAATTHNSINR